jgi:bifunctional non-homologous end joining protein LigD
VKPEEISKPDKPLFPDGTTKLDLATYYDAVGAVMVPHVAGRPLNLERYPDGIEAKQLFTQQAPKHFPDWIGRATVPKQGGTVDHVLVERPETLVYLAGQACITLHMWMSRRDRLERPDRLIIDLDPAEQSFAEVRAAAHLTGELFRECGLAPFALVTGSKGIHVVAPLKRTSEHAQVAEVGKALAAELERRDPRALTTAFTIKNREGKIYLDAGRVRWGHTAVAPYSVRARDGAPVATPLAWSELDDDALTARSFTIRDVPERLARHGDPWADIAAHATGLSRARRALGL